MSEIQFPELHWSRRSSTLNTVVEHGVMLKERGFLVIPDFQRDLVWTKEQAILFIESLILKLPVGEYTLHRTQDRKSELLDGQQRWNAIFGYMNDEFPVFGFIRWSDLNERTRDYFLNLPFSHRLIEGLTREETIEVYERLAYGGTPHTPKLEQI